MLISAQLRPGKVGFVKAWRGTVRLGAAWRGKVGYGLVGTS